MTVTINATCTNITYGTSGTTFGIMANPTGVTQTGQNATVTFSVNSVTGLTTNDANVFVDAFTLTVRNIESPLTYFPGNNYTISIT